MAGLAESERAKRRRLQDMYADLRPAGSSEEHRKAKLRSLLLGAAADAGLAANLSEVAADGSKSGASRPQPARELAAAAAVSISAVQSTLRCNGSSPGQPRTAPVNHPTRGAAGVEWRQRQDGVVTAASTRALPPGPMEGGFLPEVDPIQRLIQLQVPLAATVMDGNGIGWWEGPDGTAALPCCSPALALPQAASAATPRYNDDGCDDDVELDVPSDVELALIAVKSDLRAHLPSAALPPMVLRSQLSCILVDKLTVERQLDEQRRANRVRVFKLPTGPDEFGVLLASDYRSVVRQAADDTAASAIAEPAPSSTGAYGTATVGREAQRTSGGSRWHAASEAFLCRIVDRCTDFQLSRDHLVHLLRTPSHQPPPRQQPQPTKQLLPEAAKGCQDVFSEEYVDEQISLLLQLGFIARHTDGDADAFVLAVPGAGKLVKSVVAGRRELLAWLGKRQHQEAPEEQIRKLKLRGCHLPPQYLAQDLVGRGAVKRLVMTCGPVLRLSRKKGVVAMS